MGKKKKTQAKASSHDKTYDEVISERDFTKKPKLHGAMLEDMVDHHVERTGMYPFTFTTAFLLFFTATFCCVILPYMFGENSELYPWIISVSMSIFMPLSLSFGRYFVDSKRGICTGFYKTLIVTFAIVVVVCYLLFVQGVVLIH